MIIKSFKMPRVVLSSSPFCSKCCVALRNRPLTLPLRGRLLGMSAADDGGVWLSRSCAVLLVVLVVLVSF